jgi:bisanhydrobacterioruberin hydratase
MERPNYSHNPKITSEKILIIVMYILLVAGGLWHNLGLFQNIMKILAAPMMLCLALLMFIYVRQSLTLSKISSAQFVTWSIIVLITSFIVEFIGVKTGKIFGSYTYGEILLPKIGGVPIVIGCAWYTMLISSIAVSQRIFHRQRDKEGFLIISTSILMVLFDLVMEHAALKLEYWNWKDSVIPFKNYIAWFMISFFLLFIAKLFKLFNQTFPGLAFHAFWGQLIYFFLVIS